MSADVVLVPDPEWFGKGQVGFVDRGAPAPSTGRGGPSLGPIGRGWRWGRFGFCRQRFAKGRQFDLDGLFDAPGISGGMRSGYFSWPVPFVPTRRPRLGRQGSRTRPTAAGNAPPTRQAAVSAWAQAGGLPDLDGGPCVHGPLSRSLPGCRNGRRPDLPAR